MELALYLRDQVKSVRDSYTTTPWRRRRLYLFAKQHEETIRERPYIRTKMGGRNYRWLVGLIDHGDEHDWYDMAVKETMESRSRT